jgi:putative transposase
VVRLARAAWYRPPPDRRVRDAAVIEALTAVVERHGRWGFWKLFGRLRLSGRRWNHKRVHRVYCALRLNRARRTRRRVPRRVRVPLSAPPVLNQTWALDFMRDTLYDGRVFRTLNVLDQGNREALAIEIGCSLPSRRVLALLDELVALHGAPRALRMDNGPEFLAGTVAAWAEARGITLDFIQPGKPAQNAFIERFNQTYRTEVLDANLFTSLAEARALTADWLPRYNTERPHDSLGGVPPLVLAQANQHLRVPLCAVYLTGELTQSQQAVRKDQDRTLLLGNDESLAVERAGKPRSERECRSLGGRQNIVGDYECRVGRVAETKGISTHEREGDRWGTDCQRGGLAAVGGGWLGWRVRIATDRKKEHCAQEYRVSGHESPDSSAK